MSYDPAAAFNDGYELMCQHIAEEWEPLLSAARDALRSYQYGNASPDLAKEIADKIDAQLSIQQPPPDAPPFQEMTAACMAARAELHNWSENFSLWDETRPVIAQLDAALHRVGIEVTA